MLLELKTIVRFLSRNPAYTLAVVLILGVGIGASTAIFSVIMPSLLAGRNFPRNVVRIESNAKGASTGMPLFLARFAAYRDTTAIIQIGGLLNDNLNLVTKEDSEGVSVGRVTTDYFRVLEVQPYLGRLFSKEDETTPTVVVLSYPFWRGRFQGDPAIVGKEITLNGTLYTVIGVLPRSYTPPAFTAGRIFIPFVVPPTPGPREAMNIIATVATLKPGVSPSQLQAELATLNQTLASARQLQDYTTTVLPIGADINHSQVTRGRVMQWTALGSVAFLYAIACINAAGLLLVRATGLRKELGVRLALGSNRWGIIRPFFTEGILLATLAVAVGALTARWLFPALVMLSPNSDNQWIQNLKFSWGSFSTLAALGMLTGAAIALLPAWRALRTDVNSALKEDSHAVGESKVIRNLRGALIVFEVTLAVTLLTTTGLMLKTFQRLQAVNVGYGTANRAVASIRLPRDFSPSSQVRANLNYQIVEKVSHLPGVEQASMASSAVPQFSSPRKLKIRGRPDLTTVEGEATAVTSEFFETFGLPMRLGQSFRETKPGKTSVVVINEAMARRYFGEQNPLGQVLEISANENWEIIGVAADTRTRREEARPRYYFPFWQSYIPVNEIVLRYSTMPGGQASGELRKAIYEIDPKLAVMNFRMVERILEMETQTEQFILVLLQVLAGLATLLALAGVYMIMAYSIAQRMAEFGIRRTLGASPLSLYRMVLGRGLLQVMLGIAGGFLLTLALSRFIQALLFQTPGFDQPTYLAVCALMLIATLPACWLPVRRALRVNISNLLRSE